MANVWLNLTGSAPVMSRTIFKMTRLNGALQRFFLFIINAMSLTREEVIHIAKLARLALSDAEVDQFQVQLSQILQHVEQLQQVDTAGIEPTTNMLQSRTVLRTDEPHPTLSPAQVLQNARTTDKAQFRVPPVLE